MSNPTFFPPATSPVELIVSTSVKQTPSLPASGSSSNANKRKLTAPTPPVFGRSVVDVPEGAADPDDDDDVDQDNDERREEEFAPGNDADYFVEEDEDGRFL